LDTWTLSALETCEVLGTGKEGSVLYIKGADSNFVYKMNKEFGTFYQPITEYTIKKLKSIEKEPGFGYKFLNVVSTKNGYYYKTSKKFHEIMFKHWKVVLGEICYLNSKMIPHGIALWDFGIPSSNFMWKHDMKDWDPTNVNLSDLVMIDFGGGGFSFLKDHNVNGELIDIVNDMKKLETSGKRSDHNKKTIPIREVSMWFNHNFFKANFLLYIEWCLTDNKSKREELALARRLLIKDKEKLRELTGNGNLNKIVKSKAGLFIIDHFKNEDYTDPQTWLHLRSVFT